MVTLFPKINERSWRKLRNKIGSNIFKHQIFKTENNKMSLDPMVYSVAYSSDAYVYI